MATTPHQNDAIAIFWSLEVVRGFARVTLTGGPASVVVFIVGTLGGELGGASASIGATSGRASRSMFPHSRHLTRRPT